MAEEVMGGPIDLDPYSCEAANEEVCAERILTKQDDALVFAWPKASRVWCNCPYTRDAGTAKPYLERLVEMHDAGVVEQAIVLTNASTSTNWWQDMARRFAFCLVDHRINFVDGTGEHDGTSPRYANSFFHLPPLQPGSLDYVYAFGRIFGEIGAIGGMP
jgi:hypothetical protein